MQKETWGKVTRKVLIAIVLVMLVVLLFQLVLILEISSLSTPETGNYLDFTGQMNQTEKENLDNKVAEFNTVHNDSSFFVYHTEEFDITDEYIKNLQKVSDNKNIFYVYMRANSCVYKIIDNDVTEIGTAKTDSEFSDVVLLDMAKADIHTVGFERFSVGLFTCTIILLGICTILFLILFFSDIHREQ